MSCASAMVVVDAIAAELFLTECVTAIARGGVAIVAFFTRFCPAVATHGGFDPALHRAAISTTPIAVVTLLGRFDDAISAPNPGAYDTLAVSAGHRRPRRRLNTINTCGGLAPFFLVELAIEAGGCPFKFALSRTAIFGCGVVVVALLAEGDLEMAVSAILFPAIAGAAVARGNVPVITSLLRIDDVVPADRFDTGSAIFPTHFAGRATRIRDRPIANFFPVKFGVDSIPAPGRFPLGLAV